MTSFTIDVSKVRDLASFKNQAKQLKKALGISSCQAHELLAKHMGFNTYNHYLSVERKFDHD